MTIFAQSCRAAVSGDAGQLEHEARLACARPPHCGGRFSRRKVTIGEGQKMQCHTWSWPFSSLAASDRIWRMSLSCRLAHRRPTELCPSKRELTWTVGVNRPTCPSGWETGQTPAKAIEQIHPEAARLMIEGPVIPWTRLRRKAVSSIFGACAMHSCASMDNRPRRSGGLREPPDRPAHIRRNDSRWRCSSRGWIVHSDRAHLRRGNPIPELLPQRRGL